MSAEGASALRIEAAVRITDQDGSATTVLLTNEEAVNPFGAADLEYNDAADLTARIADAVQHTEELIARAYIGRAWKVLGFASWNGWIEKNFGDRPILNVSRSDRMQAVASLTGAGLSTRAIGRIVGADKKTVANDLRALESSGGEFSPPDTVVGADGRSYPRPQSKPVNPPAKPSVAEACALCGELGHLTDDCPETSVVDDSPIVSRDEWVTDETVYGLGATSGRGEAEPHLDNLGDGLDDEDVDSETEPGPFGSALPSDVAHQRVGRLVSNADRLVVARDDLEELGPIIVSMHSEVDDWPDSAVGWPADLAGTVREQLAGIRAVVENLTEILQHGDALVGLLEAGAASAR